MASEIYAQLKFDGTDVEEDHNSTFTPNVAGEDFSTAVECTSFRYGMNTPTQQGGQVQSGRHVCEPISLSFRATGKSTHQWLMALDRNHSVEGTFKSFRPAVGAGAQNELASTVTITAGRVIRFEIDSPDMLHPESAGHPMMCHAVISYHTLSLTTDGGEHEVSWGVNA